MAQVNAGFAVLADCKVEPLITLPQASTAAGSATVSGGGIRNPGNISPGPNPGVGQGGGVMPIAAVGAATLATTMHKRHGPPNPFAKQRKS